MIEFNKGKFLIDGTPGILYSGELPCFRIPKQDWQKRMQIMKDCGFNALSTYIPWEIYEQKKGRIDSFDDPWRPSAEEPEKSFYHLTF